jgi:RluA family pseudouridine synthase
LSQLYHYHENPVAATNIDIIYQDSEMLLISKPAGIPIHPTGKYHFNSCTEILKHEHGFGELYPVNRLDMLTSGLTILAKTKEKASEFGKLFAENKVEKMYIALVNGEFPLKSECKEPLLIEPNKHGHVIVSPSGKESMTEFKRRFFNGETSLVECYPKTGRTHQIRVHLQYLGYPIVNDPIYGTAKKTEHPLRQNTYHGCYECKNPRLDPTPDELYICLHSTRYIIADMRLEAPPPDWAGKHF